MKLFLLLILMLAFLNALNQPAKVDYSQPPEWEREYYTATLSDHGPNYLFIGDETGLYYYKDGVKCWVERKV